MRMKKLAMLSIGILAFALQPANAQTSLFTTYDDFTAFTAAWGSAPVAQSSFSTDASTINGIGNLTAPGGAGTSGSLLITAAAGASGGYWADVATGPSQAGNLAFLEAIDPGYANDNNTVAVTGNFYVDYSLPDNEGGSTFGVGILLQYAGNGYFGTYFQTSAQDLGFTDPNNGGEVYRATIPFTIAGGGQFSGLGFGVMVN